jgi:hypothetical protein
MSSRSHPPLGLSHDLGFQVDERGILTLLPDAFNYVMNYHAGFVSKIHLTSCQEVLPNNVQKRLKEFRLAGGRGVNPGTYNYEEALEDPVP